MENYLAIITTILVVTQVVRVTQNALQLKRQNKLIQAQLDELEEVTDQDIVRKREVDKLLTELLPKILDKIQEE